MAARPTVTIHDVSGGAAGSAPMPAVLTAPIRRDVVHYVHMNIAKNSRQAYAVSKHAGEQTSAESWGTGRAVARIPRVGGGGTHRSGQGAFGNMCRKGRMFAPTKIWRRWHRHVNVNQRRYAIVSALAASAVPALVMARGHRVERLPEIPLVVAGLDRIAKTSKVSLPPPPPSLPPPLRSSSAPHPPLSSSRNAWPPRAPPWPAAAFPPSPSSSAFSSSRASCVLLAPPPHAAMQRLASLPLDPPPPPPPPAQAVAVLESLGAADDVRRVEESKAVRAGKGKGRNRRYVSRRGPLLVTASSDGPAVARAFRNLAGVDIANVDRLNLLQLAPGGHVGRFVIWTADAFATLEKLYGTVTASAEMKAGYTLPRAHMANADLARIINSNEIQAAVRPAVKSRAFARQKKNPLVNKAAMAKLNPYAAVVRQAEVAAAAARAAAKGKKVAAKRTSTVRRNASKAYFRSMAADEFVRPADAKAPTTA